MMDEQLKTKLIGYLDTIESKVQAGHEFVAAEAPLAVQEWLRWMAVESGVYAVLCMITAVLCQWLVRKFYRDANKLPEDQQMPYFFGICVCLIFGLISVPVAIESSVRCAKVIIAPRVVVIEKVAELTGLSKQK
jgi:hypothetical protein